MSAFVVCHDHIDALLTFAVDKRMSFYDPSVKRRIDVRRENATELGRVLLAENEKSVSYRYGDEDDMPGTVGETAKGYRFQPNYDTRLTPVMILKACDCLEYQSCEHDTYKQSRAWALLDTIRGTAISALPGYNDAPWGFVRKRAA